MTSSRPITNSGAGWRQRAACRDVNPELFFPVGSTGPALLQAEKAKQVCQSCPVSVPCREFAISIKAVGVWGGTTDSERHAVKRRDRRRELRAKARAAREVTEKRCPCCLATKPAEDFPKDRRQHDGLYRMCKRCTNRAQKANRARNHETAGAA